MVLKVSSQKSNTSTGSVILLTIPGVIRISFKKNFSLKLRKKRHLTALWPRLGILSPFFSPC